MLLIALIESFYIYYMYNIFKTTLYFHHPLELVIQNSHINNYFKHPISNEIYESKICPFGNLVGKVLAIWILLRIKLLNIQKINYIIWIMVLIGSLVMNMNAFIYLIPVFIFERFYVNSISCL